MSFLLPKPQHQNNSQAQVSLQGQLTDHQHGLHIAAVEAGTGHVTRQNPGKSTRFTFKTPFKKTPHVQLTLCNSAGSHVPTELYLLGDNGPAVDPEGFSVGIYSNPGHTAEFRYLAMTLLETSQSSASETGTTKPETSTVTKPKSSNTTKPKTSNATKSNAEGS